MFAGMVESVGEVTRITESSSGMRLGIFAHLFAAAADSPSRIGDSICVSGVCLTITELEKGVAFFDIASETRRVTTLGAVTVGVRLNLERSLRVGDRIHGHFVTGHVDAVTAIAGIRDEGGNTVRFELTLPAGQRKFVAPKGAITVNGTSLTVGEVTKNSFSVYVIPHTLEVSTFGTLRVGDQVNLEIDVLARYVARALGESHSNGK